MELKNRKGHAPPRRIRNKFEYLPLTFREPGSQSNEHSSFVTFPCELPLAILTLKLGFRLVLSFLVNTKSPAVHPGFYLKMNKAPFTGRPRLVKVF